MQYICLAPLLISTVIVINGILHAIYPLPPLKYTPTIPPTFGRTPHGPPLTPYTPSINIQYICLAQVLIFSLSSKCALRKHNASIVLNQSAAHFKLAEQYLHVAVFGEKSKCSVYFLFIVWSNFLFHVDWLDVCAKVTYSRTFSFMWTTSLVCVQR